MARLLRDRHPYEFNDPPHVAVRATPIMEEHPKAWSADRAAKARLAGRDFAGCGLDLAPLFTLVVFALSTRVLMFPARAIRERELDNPTANKDVL
jgi:hypothetical protein